MINPSAILSVNHILKCLDEFHSICLWNIWFTGKNYWRRIFYELKVPSCQVRSSSSSRISKSNISHNPQQYKFHKKGCEPPNPFNCPDKDKASVTSDEGLPATSIDNYNSGIGILEFCKHNDCVCRQRWQSS